ncbi:membrane protein [Streptomyces olindensis]|nr:membrane protein [Streptomyces olindensis]
MTAPHARATRSGHTLRILRAAVFAAVCVVLAGAGHALASCDGIPLWTLGAGFLGVAAVAAPLAGRARSLPGIALLLAVGQTVLHTLFGLGQHGAAAATSSVQPGVSDAALVQQAARLVCGTTAAAISPAQAHKILTDARLQPTPGVHTTHLDAASGSLWPSLPMLLGHVLAAIAAGWLLRHGDLALLRLTELSAQGVTEGALVRALRAALALVRALRAGLPGTPEAPQRPAHAVRPAPEMPRTDALQHTVIRRGPPAVTVSALALAA